LDVKHVATPGKKWGIVVRSSNAGPHSLPDLARSVLVETFSRIYALSRKLNEYEAPELSLDACMARIEERAQLQGLVMQFAEMLRFYDPLVPSCQSVTWGPPQKPGEEPDMSAQRLFDLIYRNWSANLRPLPKEEDTDEVWALFFAAVDAAQRNGEEAATKIQELRQRAPQSDARCEWSWRVYYYASKVAPEYTRWFTGIEGETALPRI
jgi:hypothetical protein